MILYIVLKIHGKHRPIQDEPEIAKKNKKKGYFSRCRLNCKDYDYNERQQTG